MTKPIALRHYCGELVYAEVYRSHGEDIPAFFSKDDPMTLIRDCPNCHEELDLDYCGSPWLVEPMDDLMAQFTASSKFCSNCWGHGFDLVKAYDIGGNFIGTRVVCVNCREETVGYVSIHHITAQKADDMVYYKNDFEAISHALGIEIPKRERQSVEQNLSELGF